MRDGLAACAERPAPRGAQGWEAQEDDDGNVFYHNEVTEETTWTKPRSGGDDMEVGGRGGRGGGATLLHGWEEHVDDDGTTYFYNEKERRATWSLPSVSHSGEI